MFYKSIFSAVTKRVIRITKYGKGVRTLWKHFSQLINTFKSRILSTAICLVKQVTFRIKYFLKLINRILINYLLTISGEIPS